MLTLHLLVDCGLNTCFNIIKENEVKVSQSFDMYFKTKTKNKTKQNKKNKIKKNKNRKKNNSYLNSAIFTLIFFFFFGGGVKDCNFAL